MAHCDIFSVAPRLCENPSKRGFPGASYPVVGGRQDFSRSHRVAEMGENEIVNVIVDNAIDWSGTLARLLETEYEVIHAAHLRQRQWPEGPDFPIV